MLLQKMSDVKNVSAWNIFVLLLNAVVSDLTISNYCLYFVSGCKRFQTQLRATGKCILVLGAVKKWIEKKIQRFLSKTRHVRANWWPKRGEAFCFCSNLFFFPTAQSTIQKYLLGSREKNAPSFFSAPLLSFLNVRGVWSKVKVKSSIILTLY